MMNKNDLLDLALKSGMVLTGKPDGSEAVSIKFDSEAWQNFANNMSPERFTTESVLKNEIDQLRKALDELSKIADSFDKIRKLMGYVENGTDQAVTFYQDDATKTYIVTFPNLIVSKAVYADKFETVIDLAYQNIPDENK